MMKPLKAVARLGAVLVLPFAVAVAAASGGQPVVDTDARDAEFLRHAYAYGLNPKSCPDELPEEITESCIDPDAAIYDGRELCNMLYWDFWGPPERWRPEYAHGSMMTSYGDGRASWLAAARVYCPQFLAAVHGAYLQRGAPVYHGPAIHVPPDPLPYDYPPGGLCIRRYSDWPGFAQACPNPIP